MSDELKPCPFCGGEAITPTNWGDPSRPIPRCRDCRAEAPSPEAWNRRTPGPDVARLLAAAKRLVSRVQIGWECEELRDAIAEYEAAHPA